MASPADIPTVDGVVGLEVIGQGGFATVYRGRQPAFHRDVAVKVLARSGLGSDDRRRFERECQAMGKLSNHPGIVTLFDAGFTADERPYLVMAFVPDGTLQDQVAVKPLTWQEVTVVGVELAGALETAHRAGVIHRDIKSANVLCSEYGTQLSDFGIARLQGGHETKSGVITASIAHAPPEILDGKSPSVRSDVYSLGSTLYEALTGRPAFVRPGDEGMLPLIRRVMAEPVPELRDKDVPDEVASIVEKAMEKEPEDRYASAEDLGLALCAAQAALGINVSDLRIVGNNRGGNSGHGPESTVLVTDSVVEDATPPSQPVPPPPAAEPEAATTPRPARPQATPPPAEPEPTPRPSPPEPAPAAAEVRPEPTPPPAQPVVDGTVAVVHPGLDPWAGAPPQPPPTPPPTRSGGSAKWIVPIALGAVVALVVGVLFLRPSGGSDSEGPDVSPQPIESAPASNPLEETTVPAAVETTIPTAVETTVPAVERAIPTEAVIVSTTEVPADTTVDGFVFGGIDGLSYDSEREQLLAVRERTPGQGGGATPSPDDAAVLRIPVGDPTGSSDLTSTLDFAAASASPLLRSDGTPYGPELDVEGAAVLDDGSFYVVSEGSGEGDSTGDPFVHRFGPDDARFQDELRLPDWYLTNPDQTSGISPGRGLHGIGLRPGFPDQVVVAVETPLIQDHDPLQLTEPKVARLIAFDTTTGEATAEWGYPLDQISPAVAAADSTAASQIVDIAGLADGSLVVVEFTDTEEGDQLRLYRAELGSGTPPNAAVPPAVDKTRLLVPGDDSSTMLLDFRSITRGPTLADGRSTLVLATDNEFSEQPTQMMVLGVDA